MDVRRCLICSAVVGLCLHTAADPYDAPHVDPPQPHQFAVPTVTVSASTQSPRLVGSGARIHVVLAESHRSPVSSVLTLRAPLVP